MPCPALKHKALWPSLPYTPAAAREEVKALCSEAIPSWCSDAIWTWATALRTHSALPGWLHHTWAGGGAALPPQPAHISAAQQGKLALLMLRLAVPFMQ